jgi:hypothetical protein
MALFLLKGVVWLLLGFFSEAPEAVSLATFLFIPAIHHRFSS